MRSLFRKSRGTKMETENTFRQNICSKSMLSLGVAAAALIYGSPVLAQVSQQEPAISGTEAVPTAQADAERQLDVVVVTANKRAESVQDVGTSVSVITGAMLTEQKLEKLADYVAYIPGVTATNAGAPGQTSLTVRGISPLSAGSKVATYIDEAPVGSSAIWAQAGGLTLDLLPFDLDRLELLRGPQGTLYGASSMGGLLKYVLKTPDAHQFSADVSADMSMIESGEASGASVQGRVNVPIAADIMAVSASGFYKLSPGYIDNDYTGANDTNDAEQYGGRLAAFWQATPDLTVKLNALVQKSISADNAVVSVLAPTVAQNSALSPKSISGGTSLGDLVQYNPFAAEFTNDVEFYSGTLNWQLGQMELVSATSWSDYKVKRLANRSQSLGTYFPAFGLPEGLVLGTTELGTEKFTQELRLVSPQTNAISWQIGGFYTQEEQSNLQLQDAFANDYSPIVPLLPNASYINIPTTYEEYAAFIDATWALTPKFDISGGVRYSENHQVFNLSARGALAGLPQMPLVALETIRSKENNTTWSAGSRYHFTPDVMAYVRAATGYAPGGANSPIPGVPQAVVESETLTSYEAGLKSQFLDNRALVNISVFKIDWENIQLRAQSGAVGYNANGGSATSQGVELASTFEPFDGVTLGLNAAYTDATLSSLNPLITTAFIVGEKLQNVPEWAVSGTVDYAVDMGNGWDGKFSGAVRWVDEQLGAQPASGAPLFTLPAYTVADLRASFKKGDYDIGLYVRNLTDERAYSGAYPFVGLTGGIQQIDYYVIQPRTLGVSVSKHF
jgi:iron complex outermembrane recepter protein